MKSLHCVLEIKIQESGEREKEQRSTVQCDGCGAVTSAGVAAQYFIQFKLNAYLWGLLTIILLLLKSQLPHLT